MRIRDQGIIHQRSDKCNVEVHRSMVITILMFIDLVDSYSLQMTLLFVTHS